MYHSPREHSEMSAKFEVRGNTVAAPGGASVVPADETDVGINYGGTRSGEEPVRVSPYLMVVQHDCLCTPVR